MEKHVFEMAVKYSESFTVEAEGIDDAWEKAMWQSIPPVPELADTELHYVGVSSAISVFVQATCASCAEIDTVEVDAEMYEKWLRKLLSVQDAFPQLSAAERETLIGSKGYYLCNKCWSKEFGDDDDA
jgi:hypothetical protein